ncbi:hypothetical protein E4K72_04390, partial [Oxalobacteraceae bacterium OM1]
MPKVFPDATLTSFSSRPARTGRLDAIQRAAWETCPAWLACAAGLILAVLFIGYTYPLSFLSGHGEYFEGSDAAQHVTGWLLYVQDAWHFPLTKTGLLNSPAGVSIAFTDSIPLAALVFKSLRGLLPPGFHYFGGWHALAYLGQGAGAVALVRALGVRHLAGAVAAAAFALMWPPLLHRMGHTSLMTHGVLLFALAAYFAGCRQTLSVRAAGGLLIALSIAALAIHPYLFAMCFPICIAFLLDAYVRHAGWRGAAVMACAAVAGVLALAGLLGYFGHGSTVTDGFGAYSMNLASPFCGGRLALCEGMKDAAQGEGLNYFGGGLLLLLPLAAWMAVQRRSLPIRRHAALAVVLIGMALYALSNQVYAGHAHLLTYPLPAAAQWITGTFRASGRFFWPVGYLVMGLVVATVLRRPSWPVLALVAGALGLQWFDTASWRDYDRSLAAKPSKADLAAWQPLMAGVERISLYPVFGCGNFDAESYVFFQRLAARYGMPMNTGYVARPGADCRAERQP